MGGVEPQETEPELRRTLSLRTVVSTSAGLTFASSTFLVVVTIGMLMPGNAAWLPILIAGALCALAAAAFSELNGLYPSLNGIRVWITRAFGEKVALVTAFTYMSVVALVVGAEAYVLSYVLNAAVPAIAPPLWIFLMLTAATAANFRGLNVAGALQDAITYAVVASILGMSFFVLSHHTFHLPNLMNTGGGGNIFTAVGFAIFLFVGFEWVTPLADEVRSPRDIAKGMFLAVALLTAVYALLATAMFAGPNRQALFGTDAHRIPTPHLVFALREMGPVGRVLMIVTSLCMSLTTFNAGLMSVSRFIHGGASEHLLPPKLAHIEPRYAVPSTAIFAVYVLALGVSFCVYFTKRYILLVNLAAATEALIYAFACACVVSLRLKEREKERDFRMWGGIALPAVTALLFVGVGLGVFFQPGWETWGAGIALLIAIAGWWLYIRFVAIPRRDRYRAERAAKRSRRPQRSG